MRINVNIEQTQPLVGSASTGRERPVPFVGWLELLRVIADLAESADRPVISEDVSLATRNIAEARPS
jgi:hypothetical protein